MYGLLSPCVAPIPGTLIPCPALTPSGCACACCACACACSGLTGANGCLTAPLAGAACPPSL